MAKKITKKYKTVKGLLNQMLLPQDLTLTSIKTGRFYHKTLGRINFELDGKVIDDIYIQIALSIGGDFKKVLSGIKYKDTNYMTDRIAYGKCIDKFEYIVGQESRSEYRALRNYFSK